MTPKKNLIFLVLLSEDPNKPVEPKESKVPAEPEEPAEPQDQDRPMEPVEPQSDKLFDGVLLFVSLMSLKLVGCCC